MKKILFLFFILFSSNAFSNIIKKKNTNAHLKRYVADEIIVKYRSTLSESFQRSAIERVGGRRLRRLNSRGLAHIKLNKNADIMATIEEYKKDPDVEFAQPNYIYKISSAPNDPKYSQEWGLKNTGQTIISPGGPNSPDSTNNPGSSGSDMGLETAWNSITDCSSVIVAVLDTGVNYNHTDLAANMWDGTAAGYPNHGYDFVESTNNPMDKNGHGTHVAGTIGAVGNNALGTTGVCWKASIMAVRVLNTTGSGTTSGIIQGIDFAVAQGAKVINMSLGGGIYDAAYDLAITNAQSSGVIVVVAAGNEATNNDSGASPSYPCNFSQSNIICVAALDQKFGLASFSNYGLTSVDVGAPGTNIVSTWPGTETTISDALTSGWSFSSSTSSGFGYKSLNYGVATNCLVTPPTYNHTTVQYVNNTDDRAWKTFDLSGATSATLNYYAMVDTELDKDKFNIYASTTTGDPIVSGTKINAHSGTTESLRIPLDEDLTPYISANTTVGFNFTSDANNVDLGLNISLFSIKKLVLNNTSYNVIEGTSMATPHVAGLVAMIAAFNPNYTYSDVIASIKNGGVNNTALAGRSTTGKAVSAASSLAYILPPTGGSAVKLP